MRVFLAPLALIAIGGFVGTPVLASSVDLPVAGPVPIPASTAACPVAVSVTGIYDKTAAAAGIPGQHWAAPGDTVEVDGAGFQQGGCAVTVTIGDAPPIAVAATAVAPAGTSLTLAAPALSKTSPKGLNGPVTVQLRDAAGQVATSNSTYHFLERPPTTVLQSQPAEGSSFGVTGYGFNSGGDPIATSTLFSGCPATGSATVVATVQSDTAVAATGPATYCDGAVWVTRTSPHYDTAPNPSDDAPITVTSPAGSVDIAAVVSSVSPTTASPGSVIDVRGSGFGPSGTAALSGVAAGTAWSDQEVIVQVPSAPSGRLVLTRATGDHASFTAAGITMTPAGAGGSTGGGGATPGSGLTSTGTGGYPFTGANGIPASFQLPAGAVPAAKSGAPRALASQQTPDRLTIAAASTRATVSKDVAVTVTFLLSDKPVAGAPVTVSLVSSPGSDAAVKPATGRTDDKGVFHATLHLSHLAGDHLLLARSGTFSDEVHVLGQAAETGSSIKLPFGNINVSGNPLVVWLSVACFALILLGVIVNINVMRRFLWANSGGRLISLAMRHRRRPPVAAP